MTDTLASQGDACASTLSDFVQPPAAKRARLSDPPASSSSLPRSIEPPRGDTRLSLPPHMRNLAGMPTGAYGWQTGSADPPTLPPQLAEPAAPVSSLSTPPSTLFAQNRSSVTSATTPLSSPTATPAGRPGTAVVASFLAGLDSALVPLADHLADIGVDSLDALVHLATLSAGPRQALLGQLHQRVVVRDPACPSPRRLAPYFPAVRL